MLQWTVGAVTVKRIVELDQVIAYNKDFPFMAEARPEALSEIPWLYPDFVAADGSLRLSIQAFLVEAPGLRLMVDTCVGNDRVREFICAEPLDTPFLGHMIEAGWPPETVEAVVCTHLHVDHVGWNTRLADGKWVPTFPNARHLIARPEYEHYSQNSTGEQRVVFDDSVQPIFDAGLAQLVETDHRLSPEIRLVPTPGHTPGHVSVMIESQGERAMITRDAIHHPSQMARPTWAPPWEFNRGMSEETRLALLDTVADQPILVIGTHFAAPTAGHVRRDGTAFRFWTNP